MEHISLPRFYCPFPSQLNPLAEEVHKHTFDWATKFRLLQKEAAIQRFHTSHFARLVAMAYPQTGFEELALTNDFLTWIFLLDDHFDDGTIGHQPEQVQIIMDGLLTILGVERSNSSLPLHGPLVDSLQELWERMLSLTTPQWQERFTRHFLACFDAYSWELRNRAGKGIPHVEIYIEKRQETGGMRLMLDFIDLTEHVNLPLKVYESSLVQALMRITNNAICWSNDIISLEKEMARGEPNNLVLAIRQENVCTLQEAVHLINEMITGEVKLFTKLSPLVLDAFPDYKQELQKYVAVMQAWIRGNLDWSFETLRYSDVEQITPGRNLSYLEAILPQMPQSD